jgi:hypothetical protein
MLAGCFVSEIRGQFVKLSGKVALSTAAFFLILGLCEARVSAQQKKPNILVIFGDAIGYWNVSPYNQGMMGYKTPNIDRLAREGALFTDYYAQQSCTAASWLEHRATSG